MKTYFKLEFKKTLLSWKTLFSIFIILALLMIPYLKERAYPYPNLDGVDYFIRIGHFTYVGYIAPLVLSLVYSTSIINDKESGFMKKILEIINTKAYFRVKFLVNTLVTALIFATSQTIVMLYFIINFGISNSTREYIGFLPYVYNYSKITYVILILAVTSLSAATFSTFVLGIITATEMKVLAFIFPLFYVVTTGIFFEAFSFNTVVNFNVTNLFNLITSHTVNGLNIIAYSLLLMLTGILLLYKFGYKRILTQYSRTVRY